MAGEGAGAAAATASQRVSLVRVPPAHCVVSLLRWPQAHAGRHHHGEDHGEADGGGDGAVRDLGLPHAPAGSPRPGGLQGCQGGEPKAARAANIALTPQLLLLPCSRSERPSPPSLCGHCCGVPAVCAVPVTEGPREFLSDGLLSTVPGQTGDGPFLAERLREGPMLSWSADQACSPAVGAPMPQLGLCPSPLRCCPNTGVGNSLRPLKSFLLCPTGSRSSTSQSQRRGQQLPCTRPPGEISSGSC